MANNKDSYIQKLEKTVQHSFDVLELCAFFEDRQTSLENISSAQDLFSSAVEVLKNKIPIQAHALFVVQENSMDMSMEYCWPSGMEGYVSKFFDKLIDKGDVAWAIREERPVTAYTPDKKYHALLHSLTMRNDVRGLFVAFVLPNSFVINNINLMLFSIVLRSCSFAYENFLLYSRIEKQKQELSEMVDNLNMEVKERAKIEEDLSKSEIMYRNVFENTGNPTIIVDKNGVISIANSQFVAFSGYARGEVLNGMNILDFFDQERSSCSLSSLFLKNSEKGQQKKSEAVFLDKQMVKRDVLVYSYPLGLDESRIISLSDISLIKTVEERLNFQAYHDQLTLLPNRAFLEDRLKTVVRKASFTEEFSYALLFIDIDRLKTINDTLGHAAGDRMIVAVSKKIKRCIRAVDTLSRFGGDEFVVLLEGVKEKTECELVMQRLFVEFDTPVCINGKDIYVTFSSGIFFCSDGHVDSEEAIRCSDIAMYRAKQKGRNQHEFYDHIEYGQEVKKLYLEQDLIRALSTDEIYLHFQPIIDLKTDKITSVEALARWKHPELGNIPPNQFIPIAESTHLIHQLGMKIFSLAFEAYARWNQKMIGMEKINLAINMSVKQFEHYSVVDDIKKCAEKNNFPLDRLHIEITESIFMDYSRKNQQVIEELNSLGVTITIDDFGTGYSSLNYLNQFAINAVKIDKSMISEISGNSKCQYIVESMVNLAQKMKLSIVAEGIEDEEQLQILQRLNCQQGQGFYFCRPLSEEDVCASLAVLDEAE